MPSSSCPRKRGACRHVLPVLYRSHASDLAGGGDDGPVPLLARRGAPTPHHGGQGKRLAPPGKVPGQLHQVLSHSSPPPSRSVSQSVRFTSREAEACRTRPSCTCSPPTPGST